jgi:hypothetical protein
MDNSYQVIAKAQCLWPNELITNDKKKIEQEEF